MATFSAVILKGNIFIRQDGTTNIKIRITHNRKADYVSTDLYILPKSFVNGLAKGKNAPFINKRIRDELDKYEIRYFQLGSIVNKMTVKELKERLQNPDKDKEIDFIAFTEEYREELKASGKHGSMMAVSSFLSNLKEFTPSLTFRQVDTSLLKSFEAFLRKRGVENAVNTYMRYFRLVFNRGRDKFNDEDRDIILIPHYPFRKYKIQKPENKTQEHCLSVEQLRMFINYKHPRERVQMAQDMFLLMFCLVGINTKDLFYLPKPDSNGRVSFSRAKTKRKYSYALEPEALAIIEKYKGDELLLNISERYGNYLDWQKYVNKELKTICKGINDNLKKENSRVRFPGNVSTNWARHSWATIARNDCRIDKDDVALCLGHEDSDNKVTDIYIRFDYSIIDESNRKVLDLLFEKKKEPVETKPSKKEGKKEKKAQKKQEKQPDEGQYLLFRDISLM